MLDCFRYYYIAARYARNEGSSLKIPGISSLQFVLKWNLKVVLEDGKIEGKKKALEFLVHFESLTTSLGGSNPPSPLLPSITLACSIWFTIPSKQ